MPRCETGLPMWSRQPDIFVSMPVGLSQLHPSLGYQGFLQRILPVQRYYYNTYMYILKKKTYLHLKYPNLVNDRASDV